MLVLVLYAAAAVGNVVSNATDNLTLDRITKPLLMPLLALWLWRTARARGVSATGIVAGLLFSAAGDIALMGSGTAWFILGMALFLGAHVCYITTFAPHGAIDRIRRFPLVLAPAAIVAVAVGALIWLWPGLWEIGMAIPMAVYAAALTTTAVTSTGFGLLTGLGGVLFLLSDMLIAVEKAGHGRPPGPAIWVMVTYIAAQTLIATGWLAYASTPAPARQDSQATLSLAGDAGEHVR
jgi:uncharacterized membrane protein YhhN